jgi:ATP/maltotriose-dependent transcriptional regulator MalT
MLSRYAQRRARWSRSCRYTTSRSRSIAWCRIREDLHLADPEHGGARAARRAAGIDAPRPERLDGLSDDLGELLGDHCAGRHAAELADRRVARRAQQTAERARDNARRLRARTHPDGYVEAPTLTPRELEVLELVSHGLSSAEIAEHLMISVGTVKTHLQNAYPKLGVNDKAAAVATALRHGLIN